jgi:hypothetical protein
VLKLTLQKVFVLEEIPAYAVTDSDHRIVGFLASKKEKGEKKWAFVFVESQFRQFVNYRYSSRLAALDALVASRELKADTGALKVIKKPVLAEALN